MIAHMINLCLQNLLISTYGFDLKCCNSVYVQYSQMRITVCLFDNVITGLTWIGTAVLCPQVCVQTNGLSAVFFFFLGMVTRTKKARENGLLQIPTCSQPENNSMWGTDQTKPNTTSCKCVQLQRMKVCVCRKNLKNLNSVSHSFSSAL